MSLETPASSAERDEAALENREAEAPLAGPARPADGPRVRRWLALFLVIAISGAIIVFRDRLSTLAGYGYPGLFLINLFSSATLFLPVPGLALAFAAGSSFHPIGVGLATGAGSTLGELTGYLAGYSGRGVIENQARYQQLRGWMARYALLVVFGLSLIPNPLFDLAGITAGVMRIPVWQFLLACFAGKVIKAGMLAYAGANIVQLIEQLAR